MRKISGLYFLLVIFFMSCGPGKSTITRKSFLNHSVPYAVINKYLEKSKLQRLDSGEVTYEVRKWSQFYNQDSFPVILERYYQQKDSLKAEVYIFYGKSGRQILNFKELENIQVDKFEIDVRNNPLDLLKNKYDLSKVDSFDLSIISKKLTSEQHNSTPKNICFEQRIGSEYLIIFIPNPLVFPGLNNSIEEYNAFASFTADSICMKDTIFSDWIRKKSSTVFGYSP